MVTHGYAVDLRWSDEDEAYVAYVPALPGCMAHGATEEAALRSVGGAIEAWIAVSREVGDDVPPPSSPGTAWYRRDDESAAVVERDETTGLLVGWIPGIPGAHTQGETLDELMRNLAEVRQMLTEDEPEAEGPTSSSRATPSSPTTDGNGASPFTSH